MSKNIDTTPIEAAIDTMKQQLAQLGLPHGHEAIVSWEKSLANAYIHLGRTQMFNELYGDVKMKPQDVVDPSESDHKAGN